MNAGASVRTIHPGMSPVTENIKEWRVKVECVLPKFCFDGLLAVPGQKYEMNARDAAWREGLGQVRIVSDLYLADSGVRLENIPREGRGWMTNF